MAQFRTGGEGEPQTTLDIKSKQEQIRQRGAGMWPGGQERAAHMAWRLRPGTEMEKAIANGEVFHFGEPKNGLRNAHNIPPTTEEEVSKLRTALGVRRGPLRPL